MSNWNIDWSAAPSDPTLADLDQIEPGQVFQGEIYTYENKHQLDTPFGVYLRTASGAVRLDIVEECPTRLQHTHKDFGCYYDSNSFRYYKVRKYRKVGNLSFSPKE